MKMASAYQNTRRTPSLSNAEDDDKHQMESSRFSNSGDTVSPKSKKLSFTLYETTLRRKRQRMNSYESTSSSKRYGFAEDNRSYNSDNRNKWRDKLLRRDKHGCYSRHRSRFEKEHRGPSKNYHLLPEHDPTATKKLYVGNLDGSITSRELIKIFERYGVVEKVDIKHLPRNTAYAFVTMTTLNMAFKAKTKLSENYIGALRCKIGYGKIIPTTAVWVGGLNAQITKEEIKKLFDRFGKILRIEHRRGAEEAQIWYNYVEEATEAADKMRGRLLPGSRKLLRTDFGNDNFAEYIKRSSSPEDDIELVSVYRQNLSDVLKQSPKWKGDFILKNLKHAVQLQLLESSNKNTVDSLLKDVNQLEIAYKLKLELPKLENIQEKISKSSSCEIFLGLPNMEDVTKQPLSELVGYLKEKSVVGFLHLSNNKSVVLGFLYVFPPCDFSLELIRRSHQVSEMEISFSLVISILFCGWEQKIMLQPTAHNSQRYSLTREYLIDGYRPTKKSFQEPNIYRSTNFKLISKLSPLAKQLAIYGIILD